MRVALLLVATVLAVAPGPAHASATDRIVLSDGPGDVWTFSDFTTGYQPATRPEADVLTARVVHGRYAVRTRMVFDDLTRVDTQWYWYDVRTPDGRTLRFVVEAKQGHWRGMARQEVEGEWVRVPGLRTRIDYASDVVKLRIARTLLDRPAWVRVRLRNELGLSDGSTFFTDNPTTSSPRAAFTPRV